MQMAPSNFLTVFEKGFATSDPKSCLPPLSFLLGIRVIVPHTHS